MKYVITGSTGNISQPLTGMLVNAGHEVSVISSQPSRQPGIEALGAKALIGSVEDETFLTGAFRGADAVYTMIPPKMDAPNWQAFIETVGKAYASAIASASVKKVVNLSAMGAHMAQGGGLVSLYHNVENKLNQLDADVIHLRPATFYTNFLGNVSMVKHMGIIGSNYGNLMLPMVHPRDIAQAAFKELSALHFSGKTVHYVVSDERSTDEIAAVLGAAVGLPELRWVTFTDEDAQNGMVGAGLSADVARNLVEMGQALASGETVADCRKHKPAFGTTKLEDFAGEFAAAYAHS